MSLATDLEIHKQGTALLDLCADVQARIPRTFRASMGYRISEECVEILVLIGRANAARQPQDRAQHINALLERLQVAQILLRTAHAKRLIATKLWAASIELTDSIGKQANGWLKSAHARISGHHGDGEATPASATATTPPQQQQSQGYTPGLFDGNAAAPAA
jgi:hypothetical protein